MPMSMNTATPLTLKIRWIKAVRCAFLVLVSPAIKAVTHVPTLEPMVR